MDDNSIVHVKRNVSLLFSGKFVSELGNGIFYIALSWFVLSRPDGVKEYGYLMILGALPSLLFTPFIGVLIDRYPKKRLLVASDVLQGVVFGCLSLLFCFDKVGFGILALISISNGILKTLFEPTVKSVIPVIVKEKDIQKANSVDSSISSFTNLFGMFAGGATLSLFGVLGCFIFNAVSFFLSGISEMFLLLPHHPQKDSKLTFQRVMAEMRNGFSYVWVRPDFCIVLLYLSILTFLVMPSGYLLFPILLKNIIGCSESAFAFIQAGFPAGIIIGAMIIMSLKSDNVKPPIATLFSASLAMSVVVGYWGLAAGFKFTANIPVFISLCASAGLMGVFTAALGIRSTTFLQKSTKDTYLGKVMSIQQLATNAVIPFGMVFFSILTSLLDVNKTPKNIQYVFFYTGGGLFLISCIVVALFQIVSRKRFLKNGNRQ